MKQTKNERNFLHYVGVYFSQDQEVFVIFILIFEEKKKKKNQKYLMNRLI